MKLTKNMRVQLSGESSDFDDYLLKIGNGKHEIDTRAGEFAIPISEDLLVHTEKQLIQYVFEDMTDNYTDASWLSSRSIIRATNQCTE